MSAAPIRVWDLPTRLFHWAIVLIIPAMWATHELDRMAVHILLGQTMLALVLFRLIWGLIGSSTARFSGFVRGPAAVAAYVRGRPGPAFGHNPLGGWSVVAMLAVLAAQVTLGLFSGDEDSLHTGPLSPLVSYENMRAAAEVHEFLFNILLGLIGFHLAAILYYRFVRRDALIAPMITGRRAAPESGQEMEAAPLRRFLLAAALAAGLTLAITRLL